MMKLEIPGKTKPYLMAHRGNNILCPENTLGAFQQAIEDGADIIETDLHLSKEGHFICIHDATTSRTTGEEGIIAELTLNEIKQYNAAAYHSGNTQQAYIPTLDEVISIIPKGIVLALELKSAEFYTQATAIKLVHFLEKRNMLESVLILSFHIEHLREIQKASAQVPVGLISMGRFSPPINLDVLGIFFPFVLVNPQIVQAAHKHHQLFCPLDTRPDKRLKFYKRLKVDAIISDNPQATRKKIDALY